MALAAACATPRAQVRTDPPPALDVPVPPPRIILPPDPTPPTAAEEPAPPAEPPQPRPSRPATPRADPSRNAEAGRPLDTAGAPKPVNGSDGGTAAAPAVEPVEQDNAADISLRRQLDRAAQDLQRVDYAVLSNDLKAQYDTARRFVTLGEQALKERNRIFAATLADKAGAIAASLLRR